MSRTYALCGSAKGAPSQRDSHENRICVLRNIPTPGFSLRYFTFRSLMTFFVQKE
jgi:hypothetical protein